MNNFAKGILVGAASYVGLKCAEALASSMVDAVGTIVGGASEFWIFDRQKARGIHEEGCDCGAIGFEIPSDAMEYEEEPEDKMQVGFEVK